MKNTIVNKSLSDQIYESLRESIIKGELRPGDRITELEIAKNFGVSQAPVREAFLRLAEDELVISHRNKGTFVSNISMDEIDELYSFRIHMEEMALKRAFERITEEDIKTLENYYQEMMKAGEENDLDGLRNTDVNFHTHIYQIADHKFMYHVWRILSSKLNRTWYLTSQVYFTNLSEVASIHEPIVKAFQQKDLHGCIEAFKNHVNYEKKQQLLRSGLSADETQ
ncbi:GntR family transcriptional regulator [Aneurinibacillus tyrosinisolvens]|uniref:GntR family transcriptional regulator n=1 Tax=Aneurinibacillus tyrosinisolvens TaxID=1443435 RepID=UPI00069B7765|nr:GntR family transcriptional regulator [Aneurinibacillus tyrosinisolvens]